jgi:S-adenosylmethionine hydrolase
MSRSQNRIIKNQREKKKIQKKKQKEERRKERRENNKKGNDLTSMMAYVDEFGNITSEPPESGKKQNETDNREE